MLNKVLVLSYSYRAPRRLKLTPVGFEHTRYCSRFTTTRYYYCTSAINCCSLSRGLTIVAVQNAGAVCTLLWARSAHTHTRLAQTCRTKRTLCIPYLRMLLLYISSYRSIPLVHFAFKIDKMQNAYSTVCTSTSTSTSTSTKLRHLRNLTNVSGARRQTCQALQLHLTLATRLTP